MMQHWRKGLRRYKTNIGFLYFSFMYLKGKVVPHSFILSTRLLTFPTFRFSNWCVLRILSAWGRLFHPLIKQFLQQISKVAFLTSITITPQKIIKIWFSYLRFISPLGWWSRTWLHLTDGRRRACGISWDITRYHTF